MNRGDKDDHEKQRAADSWRAGYTFGALMGRNNPDWTLEQIELFVSELRPKIPLRVSLYKQGFHIGFEQAAKYYRTSGNALPLDKENNEHDQ